MTGHGGWPMTCVLDHDGNPFFAGTYFPDQPRHGQPSFRQVLEALDRRVADQARRRAARGRQRCREHLGRATADWPRARSPTRRWLDAPCELLARDFDAVRGGFGGAPKFPPSMVLEFLLRRAASRTDGAGAPSRRWPAAASTTSSAAASRATPSTRRGWCRTSRRCSTTTPSCSASTPRVGGPLGDRRRPGDRRLHARASCAPPRAASPPRWTRTARASRASSTSGPRPQLVEVLGQDDGAWAAQVLRGHRGGHLRARRLDAAAAPATPTTRGGRLADVRRRLLDARAARVRPARDDKVVAAWNGLAISRALRRRAAARRPGVRRRGGRGRRAARGGCTCVDGRLLRVSRDGVVGAPRGRARGPRLRRGRVPLAGCRRPATRSGSTARGLLLDAALERFRADDGGFYDTADDAEALVARPRDPSDNATPVRPVGDGARAGRRAALTGEGRHREAAEEALADRRDASPSRRRASPAGRWPRRRRWCPTGRSRSRSSGPPGRSATPSRSRARQHPGAVVVVADGPRDDVPLLAGAYAGRRPRPRRTSAEASSASGRSRPSRTWTAR